MSRSLKRFCQDLEDLGDPLSATKRAYFEKGIRNKEYCSAIEPIILDKSKTYHDITEAVELFHERHRDLRTTSRQIIRTINNQQEESSWRGGGGRYRNSGQGGRYGRGGGGFAVEEPIEIIIGRNRVCTSQEISSVLSPPPNSGSGQNFAAKWRRDQTRTRRLNEISKEMVVAGLMLHHRT